MMARVPVRAITALRTHVQRFFDAHGLAAGQGFSDINLETFDLAEMLLAGLRYVREEYPWIGLKGIVIEPPEDEHWQLALDLAVALPDDEDLPLTVDGCIEALQKVHGFEVVDKPCGYKIAPPRAYLYRCYRTSDALRDIDLSSNIHGIVAEEHWLNSEARRTQAFNSALPPNSEAQTFFEIDADTASKLAAFLMAGPANLGAHHTYRAAAEAFAEIFGKQTRVFALEGLNDDTNPFAHGHGWSQYGDNLCGTWGNTLVVVATDGLRVAHVGALWDVESES